MNSLNYFFSILFFVFMMFGCNNNTPDIDSTQTTDYALQAADVNPVLTGTTIPNAGLSTADGEEVKLRDLVSNGPTVLIFYRGGWCPYCNRHLAELQEAQSQLQEMGYQILAVSPDKPELLNESMQENNLDYTLLSDSDMEATKAFGLAFRLDDETYQRYKNNDMDLELRSGYSHHLLPAPAVFLVNPDGMITFQYVNPDYKTRIKSEVLLSAAEAYHPDNS